MQMSEFVQSQSLNTPRAVFEAARIANKLGFKLSNQDNLCSKVARADGDAEQVHILL
jgi:hypothetical protein